MPKNKKMVFTQPKKDASAFNAFGGLKKQTETDEEKNNKLIALNLQFKDKIIAVVKDDPCVDLNPLFAKYSNFRTSIDSKTSEVKPTLILSKPEAIKVDKSESSSSSSSESEDEVKVEGPKFTLPTNPIIKDSVFSFGPKKQQPKDDSDSESDIEIKGPQFTFAGKVESNVFKLPKSSNIDVSTRNDEQNSQPQKTNEEKETNSTDASTNTDAVKPLFQFGSNVSKETSNENKKDLNPFAFGKPLSTQSETKDTENKTNPFSFSSTKSQQEISTNKPAFSFGKTSGDDNKPSFKFTSNPVPANDVTNNNPAFSFGKPMTKQSSMDKDKKPSFSFGVDKDNKVDDTPKPTFTFGTGASLPNKELNVGATMTLPSTDDKTSGEEAKISDEQSTSGESKPSFTFGNPKENTTENKPSINAPSVSYTHLDVYKRQLLKNKPLKLDHKRRIPN